MNENKNLLLVLILSTIIMVSWQYFYETPRLKKIQYLAKQEQLKTKNQAVNEINKNDQSVETIQQALEDSPRIKIVNDKIIGSIALKGARIDDISLTKYEESLDKKGEKVKLLFPTKYKDAYFVEFGWLSSKFEIGDLPNKDTIWQSENQILMPDKSVKLFWRNSQNILFEIILELDREYLFKVTQLIHNNSYKDISLMSYGRINRIYNDEDKSFAILHEGLLGVINDKLHELRYKKLRSDKKVNFYNEKNGSWFGITDKYWLSSIVPDKEKFEINFSYLKTNIGPKYQVDFVQDEIQVKAGHSYSTISHLFLGPKKLSLLEDYSKKYHIKFFDRAVDFGSFYFLTKPMFYSLQFLNEITGNFGIAIILLTVLVKLLMFPLANKSFSSMNKMKEMQPQINRLKELYGDDKLKFNQEMMSLYKKEKINPVSGCLPLIIQIPVFFSLYKVLFITIEMRQAKFFGWIKDLSIADPTSILNIFGLAPWTAPEFLSIGIWPIVMGITMYYQQKMNPEPSDPVQAKLMKFLPLIFTFMFYKFPAGLIIYWAWNNILSVLQQYLLSKKVRLNEKKKSY